MNPISLNHVRQAVAGKLLSQLGEPAPMIVGVSTDTRRLEPGTLFIALRGENFDGHNYLPQAAAGGCIAALVDHDPIVKLPNMHFIVVADTRRAMGKLASFVRRQMAVCKVVAVAGSNGKTSTKQLIQAALSARLSGSISPKSFNNDIGVPVTIFPANPLQDYLVLEMGTNHPGEIRNLTTMAEPDIAVITNCSAEHLEGLGDLRGVRCENASIIEGMKPTGTLIINGDDPLLLDAVANFRGRKITFGFGQHNDLFATDIVCDERGTTFQLNGRIFTQVFVPLIGRHVASNALAALAVARRLGVPEDAAIEALSHAHVASMRMELDEVDGIKVINDAYNANPASMRAALETLATIMHGDRRIAVLGDMRELGESSDRYHREIGLVVGALGLSELHCVGPAAKLIAETALSQGMSPAAVTCHVDADAVSRSLVGKLRRGDVVLLKGSRAMQLETVARSISQKRETPVMKSVG